MSRVIRPAEPRDAAALGRVHVECWREAYAHLLSAEFLAARDPHDTGARWSTTLADPQPDHTIAVLEVGGEVRGFAMSGDSREDSPVRERELFSIYVLASEYGTGAGQQLLDAVLGDEPASLWVATDNPRAQSFYRRNGFVLDGTDKVEPTWENLRESRMIR